MKALISGLFLAALCGGAQAGEVIANAGVEIAAGDLKDVFLGEKQLAGNVKLVPVDNSTQQAAFLTAVLNMEVTKYQGMWTKKSFRDGVNPPAVKGSDAEVAAFVKSTAGAVGYVSAAPAGVKVIRKY